MTQQELLTQIWLGNIHKTGAGGGRIVILRFGAIQLSLHHFHLTLG